MFLMEATINKTSNKICLIWRRAYPVQYCCEMDGCLVDSKHQSNKTIVKSKMLSHSIDKN